jgi:hypothetical protein
MLTPIEARIQLISLSVALSDALQWMDVHETQLSVAMLGLDSARGRDGLGLKLTDPAVVAFIEYLDLKLDKPPTSLAIHAALSKMRRSGYDYSNQAELAGLQKIIVLKDNNGWAELDRLLDCCFECSLSFLYDRVRIECHPEDTTPVGDKCYEIRIFTTTTGDDLGMITQFALASSQDFIFRLVERIVVGEMQVKDPYKPKKSAVITEIQVLHGKSTVLDAVVNYRVHDGQAAQNKPLSVNGSASSVFGDPSILKYLARTFSAQEFQVLKGKLLEDCLGL